MGKRGGFLNAVKRVLSCESKANRKKKSHKSGTWFEKQGSVNSVSAAVENGETVPAANSSMEEVKLMEAENEQNRHAYSVAIATAVAAEAAVAAAHAVAEVVRLTAAAQNLGKTKEELAAIKIQTAFRGYMARRALRALRGLVRLKSFIGGQSVKQASTTLKCMHTLARVQSDIRVRRIKKSEDNLDIQRQIQQKHEKELDKLRESSGENWDDSMLSKEQVETNIQNRKDAATKRERALAYAYSHQQTWRNSSTSGNQTFMDPNNPHWGWSWLERWMAARPWDNANSIGKELTSDQVSVKSSANRSLSTWGNAKIHSPTTQKQSRPPSRQSPSTPSSKITSRVRPSSSRGTIATDDDLKSMNSVHSDRCRRHSIAGSSVRDDESLASSPAAPGYMTPTESARARARLPSPLGAGGTLDKMSGGSAKKRLSFSGSPAGTRRHSGPPKIDTSHIKDVTTNS